MLISEQLQKMVECVRYKVTKMGKIWECAFARAVTPVLVHTIHAHGVVCAQEGAGSCCCRADIQLSAGYAVLSISQLHCSRMGRVWGVRV